MTTPVLACGFACNAIGQAGSHISATSGAGSATFSTSVKRTGTQSLHLQSTANNIYVRIDTNFALATRTYIWSVYWRCEDLPAGDTVISDAANALANNILGVGFNAATGALECFNTNGPNNALTFAGGGVVVAADTWYLVDVQLNTSANPWTIDAQVNGSALTQSTRGAAAANMSIIALAAYPEGGSGDSDFYFADLVGSQTSGDYPIGEHYVKGYVPNADGTHNLGASGNIIDIFSVDIDAATNPAYEDLDELPATLDASAVFFVSDNSGATYIELQFPNTAEASAPICVDPSVFYKGAAANAYAGSWKMSADAFANSDTIALSPATGTPARAMRKAYATTPGAGSAWTTGLFDAVTMRFGFGTDVLPDIQFDACIIEAAYAGAEAVPLPPGTWALSDADPTRVSRIRQSLDDFFNLTRHISVAPAEMPQGTFITADLERLLRRPPPIHSETANLIVTPYEPIHALNVDGSWRPRPIRYAADEHLNNSLARIDPMPQATFVHTESWPWTYPRPPYRDREGGFNDLVLTTLQDVMAFAAFGEADEWPVPSPIRRPYRDREGGFSDLVLTTLQAIMPFAAFAGVTDEALPVRRWLRDDPTGDLLINVLTPVVTEMPQGAFVTVDLERLLRRPVPIHSETTNLIVTAYEPIHALSIDGSWRPRPIRYAADEHLNNSLARIAPMPQGTFVHTESWPWTYPRPPYRDREGGFNDLSLTTLQEVMPFAAFGGTTDALAPRARRAVADSPFNGLLPVLDRLMMPSRSEILDPRRRVTPQAEAQNLAVLVLDRLIISRRSEIVSSGRRTAPQAETQNLAVLIVVAATLPPGHREPGIVAFPSRKPFVQPRNFTNLLPLILQFMVPHVAYWRDVRGHRVHVQPMHRTVAPQPSSHVRPARVHVARAPRMR